MGFGPLGSQLHPEWRQQGGTVLGLVYSSRPEPQLYQALFCTPDPSAVSPRPRAGAVYQEEKAVFQNAGIGSCPRTEPRSCPPLP